MRPISGLTRAAREVARTRDPDVTLPKPRANDEVSDLANTLEDMLRQLSAARGESEAALQRQRDFVADASHELRTPLTSILANLELLESEVDGEAREMAGSALRSSRRMRRLVADLLLLARADAGRQAPKRALDLSAVAREAATEASPLAAGQPLALDAPEAVPVLGVADDLHRLVANLIENALVHTASGHARHGLHLPARRQCRGRGVRSRARGAAGAPRARVRPLRARRRGHRPPAAAAGSAWRSSAPSPRPTTGTWSSRTPRAAAPASWSRCRWHSSRDPERSVAPSTVFRD